MRIGEVSLNTNDVIALAMGVEIIEKPTKRLWGAINMSFYDLDRNVIYI
jgi:hypothetical protein